MQETENLSSKHRGRIYWPRPGCVRLGIQFEAFDLLFHLILGFISHEFLSTWPTA